MARNPNRASGRRRAARPPDLSKTFTLLSPRRQQVFRQVLENPRAFVLLSARQLAKRLKVDPATAVRVTMKLGFGSYREFQHYLHELSVSQATSLDTLQTSKTRGSSLAAHVREAVERDLHSLQTFRNNLDADRLAALAKKVHQAKRIIILGGDLAASLVNFLHYHLILLGLSAMGATTTGAWLLPSASAVD